MAYWFYWLVGVLEEASNILKMEVLVVTFLLIHMNLLIYAKRFGDQPTAGKTSGECEFLSQVRDLQNELQSGATD